MEKKSVSRYGKKPMWQWILIYIIVGGLIYFLIYHFFLAPTTASPYKY